MMHTHQPIKSSENTPDIPRPPIFYGTDIMKRQSYETPAPSYETVLRDELAKLILQQTPEWEDIDQVAKYVYNMADKIMQVRSKND